MRPYNKSTRENIRERRKKKKNCMFSLINEELGCISWCKIVGEQRWTWANIILFCATENATFVTILLTIFTFKGGQKLHFFLYFNDETGTKRTLIEFSSTSEAVSTIFSAAKGSYGMSNHYNERETWKANLTWKKSYTILLSEKRTIHLIDVYGNEMINERVFALFSIIFNKRFNKRGFVHKSNM